MIKMGSCPVCEGEAYLKEGANGSIKMSSYHYNNCPMILDSFTWNPSTRSGNICFKNRKASVKEQIAELRNRRVNNVI